MCIYIMTSCCMDALSLFIVLEIFQRLFIFQLVTFSLLQKYSIVGIYPNLFPLMGVMV